MVVTGDQIVSNFAAEVLGKTILITGPSEQGIGAQTAIDLAAGKPKLILLAGRNQAKIQPVIDQISKSHPDVATKFTSLNLASLASIHQTAEKINSQIESLDILINNAGVMAIKDYTTTTDGIEMQFGVNHIGHFLLTNLLMGKIFAAGKGARIINVSSGGYISGGVPVDWNFTKEAYNPWIAYGNSKTANILFASALARKLRSKGILAFSVTPGLILESKLQANVTREMFAEGYETALKALNGDPMPNMEPKSLAQGSVASLTAALDPGLAGHSGSFIGDEGEVTVLRAHAVGVEKEDKMWTLSEQLVGEKFTYVGGNPSHPRGAHGND